MCFTIQTPPLCITMVLLARLLVGQLSIVKLDSKVNTSHLDVIYPVVSYDELAQFFTRVRDPLCAKTLIIDGLDM
ncbi:MAG: hypothetical protein WAU01_17230 [Saprospiraceae bacterium]